MSTAERLSDVVPEAPHDEARELTILYATETGNAEEVAERIARIAYRRHIQVRLYNIADYDKVRRRAHVDGVDQRDARHLCRVHHRQR